MLALTRSDPRGFASLRSLLILATLAGVALVYWQSETKTATPSSESSQIGDQAGIIEPLNQITYSYLKKTEFTQNKRTQKLTTIADVKVTHQSPFTYFWVKPEKSEIISRASFDQSGRLLVEIDQNRLRSNPQMEVLVKDIISHYYYDLDEDLIGNFESHKKQIEQGYFQKTKLSYTEHPEIRILTSQKRIRINESQELTLLEEYEKVNLGGFGLKVLIISETELRAISKEQGRLTLDHVSFKQSSLQIQSSQLTQVTSDTVNKPIKSLLQMMERRKDLQKSTDQLKLVKLLSDRLKQSPNELQDLIDHLNQKNLSKKTYERLVAVLFQSDDPRAHERLISDCKKAVTKDFYYNGWTVTEAILPDNAIDYLMRSANDSSVSLHDQKGAMLALGAQLGKSEPVSSELIDFMKKKYLEAKTDEEKLNWLISIGNARTNEFISEIQGFLKSSDPQMVKEGILSLRNVPSPVAEQILKTYLNHANPVYSKAAKQALEMRAM